MRKLCDVATANVPVYLVGYDDLQATALLQRCRLPFT